MVVRALAVLVTTCAVAGAARAELVRAPACTKPAATSRKVRTVKDVDWCNADVGAWKGRLREGHSSVHLYHDLGEPHDTIATSLRGIIYADVLGDRSLEALLVLEQTSWFASQREPSSSTGIRVYTLVRGAPSYVGSIPAGTPVHDITVRKRIIAVTSGPGAHRSTERYRRGTDDFVLVPTRR